MFTHNFKHITKKLQKLPAKGKQFVNLDFVETDLFNLDIGKRGGNLFLGYFSKEGVKIALEKYGLYAELKNRGFDSVLTLVDTTDAYKHKISIYNETKKQSNLLIELVLRKTFIRLNLPFQTKHNCKCFQCLTIDWLAMQNPKSLFTPHKPRLPGQKYPGLGMSIMAVELLMITCWRLKLAGLVNFPGHYHNAFLYSKIFRYIDPLAQAKFIALKRALKDMPLDKLSWGIDWGCVREEKSGEVFNWMVSEQIVPINDIMKKIFDGKKYKKFVSEKANDFKYSFDENQYQEMKKKITEKSMEKII